MKKFIISAGYLLVCSFIFAQQVSWPQPAIEAYPAARWWWMGSAVNKDNLTYNLEEYVRAGIKTLEITPIYGVKGNERNEIDFLSPRWMEMLAHTQAEAKRLGMQIDMNTGTGWPFGGPEVTLEDAATRLLFREYTLNAGETVKDKIEVEDEKQKNIAVLTRVMAFGPEDERLDITNKVDKGGNLQWNAPSDSWKVIALFNGKTLQKVKRAAPGGEGYVMDHLSQKAVKNYLGKFDKAFQSNKTSYPHTFFNDSYEVYRADWTPDFLEQFAKRRGYKLEAYLPEFLSAERSDTTARIVSDYRETMGELLIENFTRQWTAWANRHGSLTRNQAHGSPGNLIDIYAAVDIPECEGFGISDFGIKGLRKDTLTRPNDSDFSMLKYASSAAHIAGKPFTSSETFTWLTEHFRTSLSQCKPDLDLLFLSGVNHIYFHGTTYSPKEAEWPGWKFYASVDMSPTNSIWRDAPAFFEYITRCQSFLQMGKPDNDFLVYLPLYDIWYEQGGRMLMFDIHKMEQRAPKFIESIHEINAAGYDIDYISDNFLRQTKVVNGKLHTPGGISYQAIIIPAAKRMPVDVLEHLIDLTKQGAQVVFMEQYPETIPGFAQLEKNQKKMDELVKQLPQVNSFGITAVHPFGKGKVITGHEYEITLEATGVKYECMKAVSGLQCIRRSNDTGYHYFVSCLKPSDVKAWIPLAVKARSVAIFDPMTGEIGKAKVKQEEGDTYVYMDVKSGESVILQTYSEADINIPEWKYPEKQALAVSLDNGWSLKFVESIPSANIRIPVNQLKSWTDIELDQLKTNMGTGCYSISFTLPDIKADDWILDLGDVRESARVRLNGEEIGTLWAVPFTRKVGKLLKTGENTLEVEVTNLPANRISSYDKAEIEWRKFKDINFADIHYKNTNYSHWEPMPSGLLGPVKLIPVDYR